MGMLVSNPHINVIVLECKAKQIQRTYMELYLSAWENEF